MVLLGVKFSGSLIVVGSVLDRVVGHQLAVCPFLKRALYSRGSSPYVHRACNLCSKDSSICGSRGKRLKFESYGVDSLRVVWVCSKASLPDVEK